jgi:ABC-2 type transport system ATP-binding protein
MTEPLLSVENASVHAGGLALVEDVSFTARAGELTAVIGPNGAGKTSLLEAVVGLRPADGVVRLSGEPLVRFVARARAFAYLPDQPDLPAEASVRTLVEHAEAHATGKADVLALRCAFDIDSLLEKGAGVLSRGERQRVAMFSTLVLGRPIAILDEPFSAFDPLQLRDVFAAIRSVLADGTAVIASVHQLSDAEKVADRVLLMAKGRALAFGTLAELRAETGDVSASLEDIFIELLSRSARAA